MRISGLPDADGLLVEAADSWIRWNIERAVGESRADGVIDAGRANIALEGSGALVIDRAAAEARVTSPRPPKDREMVHPYLGAIAAVVSHWRGLQSFHAGGVQVGNGAFAVLGGRELGKSTLLAWLASLGMGVVADDLLVVRDAAVLAGPRCVDLRKDAAEGLEVGEAIGVVGGRERWRVPLAPIPAEVPLLGWILLRWADEVRVRVVSPDLRLPILIENLAIVASPPNPADLLQLAALPMLELLRPPRLARISEVGELLLTALRGASV